VKERKFTGTLSNCIIEYSVGKGRNCLDDVAYIEVTGMSQEELMTMFKEKLQQGYSFNSYIPLTDDNGIKRMIAMFLKR
jgi:hypothetical protein